MILNKLIWFMDRNQVICFSKQHDKILEP